MLPAVQPTDLSEQIVVRISPALRSRLKDAAHANERTEAQEVRLAIREHLNGDAA